MLQNSRQHWVRVTARNIIGERRLEVVSDIKGRTATLKLEQQKIVRSLINRVRPSVRGQRLQSMRQSPLELDLQRIVVRRCGVLGKKKARRTDIGSEVGIPQVLRSVVERRK